MVVLAVDVGNTTTNFGVFQKGRLRAQFLMATQPPREARRVAGQIGRLARAKRIRLDRAEQALICSVVPQMTPAVAGALRALGVGQVRVVGLDVRVPLKNRYRYPKQVGQDRLVGAYAALKAYKRDCIVCDFGTAITIDVVRAEKARQRSESAIRNPQSAITSGAYLGGIIAPGLGISLDALATRTALLPKVKLKEPPELLGRDTANSIRSGVLYGCVALCDGLVAQLKRRYAPKAVVVATGGASPLIAKRARTIDHLKPHLVLEGLYRLSIRK